MTTSLSLQVLPNSEIPQDPDPFQFSSIWLRTLNPCRAGVSQNSGLMSQRKTKTLVHFQSVLSGSTSQLISLKIYSQTNQCSQPKLTPDFYSTACRVKQGGGVRKNDARCKLDLLDSHSPGTPEPKPGESSVTGSLGIGVKAKQQQELTEQHPDFSDSY